MVSKTLASLDAWLVLTEEVLAEQKAQGNARQEMDPEASGSYELDQLSFFPSKSA